MLNRKNLAVALVSMAGVGLFFNPEKTSSGLTLGSEGYSSYVLNRLDQEDRSQGKIDRRIIDKNGDGVAERIYARMYAKHQNQKGELVDFTFGPSGQKNYDFIFNIQNNQGKFLNVGESNIYKGLTGNWVDETFRVNYLEDGNVSIDYNAIFYSSGKDTVSYFRPKGTYSPEELAEKQSDAFFSKLPVSESKDLTSLLKQRNKFLVNLPFEAPEKNWLVDRFCKSEQIKIFGKTVEK